MSVMIASQMSVIRGLLRAVARESSACPREARTGSSHLVGDQRADLREAGCRAVGDLRLALNLERINLRLEKHLQPREETPAVLDRVRIQPRLRMDQVEPAVAEEQLLAETRQLPLRIARRLDDVTSLLP
jgi:hypothetical protein